MPLGVLNSNTVQLSALEPLILQTAEEIKGLKESQDMLKKNHNSLVEQSNVLLLGKEIYQTQTSFAHVRSWFASGRSPCRGGGRCSAPRASCGSS